ncbi:Oidioi.mRNA.OKI2018_I69.PAR.g12401.t1.cds [Oikopleura dioica]|uniref:Oidioi.mRNA.OKI2018_I69.PAR.g12401.t1.cds n=1 Tax=Oikopleura dioica TaxID=34765 RepID=A0ABN7RZT1_OIKDI|nr:Oidioi.mRNA.OKI2018_I69.PAR.g12401.t1.cds [Oikopleura dioica]
MSEEPNSPRNGSNPESPVSPQLMKIKTESLITDNYNSDLDDNIGIMRKLSKEKNLLNGADQGESRPMSPLLLDDETEVIEVKTKTLLKGARSSSSLCSNNSAKQSPRPGSELARTSIAE